LTEVKVSCGNFSQNPNFEDRLDTAQNLTGKKDDASSDRKLALHPSENRFWEFLKKRQKSGPF